MKRISWLLAGVFALVLAVPAFAGGDEACEQSTEACLAYFAKKADNYGWVGIELDRNEESGVMTISKVVEESPAMKGGFKSGDILIALNGVELSEDNKAELKEAKGDWSPGQEVTYTIKREGKKTDVMITLAQVPNDVLAQWVGSHMVESHMEVASTQ